MEEIGNKKDVCIEYKYNFREEFQLLYCWLKVKKIIFKVSIRKKDEIY